MNKAVNLLQQYISDGQFQKALHECKKLLSNNPKVEKRCLDIQPKTQFREIFPSISNIQDFYIRRFEKY